MTKETLDKIQLKEITLPAAIAKGDVKLEGTDKTKFAFFLSLLDDFPFWFNIVTP